MHYGIPFLVLQEELKADSPAKIAHAYRNAIGMEEREVFSIMALDRVLRVIECGVMSIGSSNMALVDIPLILRWAFTRSRVLSGLVILHNHPGGEATPSTQDLQITTAVHHACHTVKLQLFDHLVVAKDGYYSFREAGLIS